MKKSIPLNRSVRSLAIIWDQRTGRLARTVSDVLLDSRRISCTWSPTYSEEPRLLDLLDPPCCAGQIQVLCKPRKSSLRRIAGTGNASYLVSYRQIFLTRLLRLVGGPCFRLTERISVLYGLHVPIALDSASRSLRLQETFIIRQTCPLIESHLLKDLVNLLWMDLLPAL
jgi:hypothetical protein